MNGSVSLTPQVSVLMAGREGSRITWNLATQSVFVPILSLILRLILIDDDGPRG